MGIFALIGAITPGPVNILAIQVGANGRRGVAMAYVLGASLSYTLVVWLMGKGGAQLLIHPFIPQVIRWAGAVYLIYLAWRIAMAPLIEWQGPAELQNGASLRVFIDGCIAQCFNPKAWMVALSGVGLFVFPQADVQAALGLFCCVSLIACGLGVGCWAVAGQVLTRWLAIPVRQVIFNRWMGVLLAASVFNMLR